MSRRLSDADAVAIARVLHAIHARRAATEAVQVERQADTKRRRRARSSEQTKAEK